MRRAICLFMLAATAFTEAAIACGDKFVTFGQGVRLQRIYAAAHPGAILLYVTPGSPLSQPSNRDRLLNMLRLAGHRPQVASTRSELDAAAATGEFDLIFAEPADDGSVRNAAKSAKGSPVVVDVLWEPTREDLQRFADRDECSVSLTRRSHDLLIVVNDIMEQRHNGAASISCRRKRA